ncbi:MAG: HAD family hydrolase [Patescibacteria group bacterium]
MERLPREILVDVDGTLTNSQRIVSVRTARAISAVIKKDIKIGVSTGRSYAALFKYILPFFPPDSLHIVAGGGQIVDGKGETIWEKKIPHEEVINICKEVERMGTNYIFGQGSTLYCSKGLLANISQHPWQIDVKLADGLKDWSTPLVSVLNINETVRNFLSQQQALSAKEIETRYQPPHLDITAQGVNRGTSASIWTEKQNISLKELLVVGDSLNDFELFQVAGLSAAMGQSPKKLKSIAQITIGDADEDGLAEYLEKLLS